MADQIVQCSLCLDTQITLPCTLSCGHIFCYVCIKNVSFSRDNRTLIFCPLCRNRQSIQELYQLVDPASIQKEMEFLQGRTFVWIYANSFQKDRWWCCDSQTSEILEMEYNNGARNIKIDIGCKNYEFDLLLMEKHKTCGQSHNRRLRRIHRNNLPETNLCGIAGIWLVGYTGFPSAFSNQTVAAPPQSTGNCSSLSSD